MEDEKKLNEEELLEGTHTSDLSSEPEPQSADGELLSDAAQDPIVNPEPVPAPEPAPKMFTQEEVNAIVGKVRGEAKERAMAEARERTMGDIYNKYGVDNDDDLDGIFGKGQTYDLLNDDYMSVKEKLEQVATENALLKSHISPERYDDVKLILKGKGLEITPESISAELATHPEWLGQPEIPPMVPPVGQPPMPVPPVPPMVPGMEQGMNPMGPGKAQIKSLGDDSVPKGNSDMDEEAILNKYFR